MKAHCIANIIVFCLSGERVFSSVDNEMLPVSWDNNFCDVAVFVA